MARALRYSPMIGTMLLVLGLVLGAAGAWKVAPLLFGASKPKTPATAPAAKRAVAPADAARTVALVDQALEAKKAQAAASDTSGVGAATPDAGEATAGKASDAEVTEPVPPEQQVSLPEYKRLERPFALRCPSVLNRYDRAGAKLEAIPAEPFCAGLRGRFSIVVFWRSDSEPALTALKLFQANTARLQQGPPPVQVLFVSADRFLSDLKAFYEAEGSSWTFDTYQALVDGWLTNYGSANPDRSFPWLLVTDPDRMVVYEGHAMQTEPELKGFLKFLLALAASRPEAARMAEAVKTAEAAKAEGADAPRKDKIVDAASKKGGTPAPAAAGRREIDYVTLGLQVMRLFPELAGTPELRQVVKAAEGSLNARLKKMSPGEANRLAANLPDNLVRDAVKAALKSIGK